MGTAAARKQGGGERTAPGRHGPVQGERDRDPARGRHGRNGGRNGNGGGNGEGLAKFLGLFSVGLGLTQLLAPEAVARVVGARDDSRTRSAMRGLGMRELTSGVGILTNPDSAGWVWSRVAGDVMDLALLGELLTDEDADRDRAAMATAAVLGVAALDVVCARRLSRDAEAREHAPRGATSMAERAVPSGKRRAQTVTILRPVDEVYAFWRDFENLPRFMRHLESVHVLDERRSHWVTRAPAGRTVEWDAEIVEDRPNELISWRSLDGSDVDNAGTVRFRRAPGDRGTEVLVELRYDPPAGKLGAMVAKLFREEPGQQVEEDLRRFKQVMETGDIVVSDATVERGAHPAQPVRSPVRQ